MQELLGPFFSSTLSSALIGLAILVIGLIVVKFIVGIFHSMLSKTSFLSKNNLVAPLTSLIKAVLTIFVLLAVLQHFGLTSVLEPLENLASQFLSAVPRIIGAGVVAYAGWVIAKIVSDLAGLGLEKFDEQVEKRTNYSEIKLSKFAKAFIFGGVLLPIIVAALGVLDIPSITVPATNMINELMLAVPNIVGAAIILIVAFVVSKFVAYMLAGLLDGMGLNQLPKKIGIENLFGASLTPVKLVTNTVIFFSMLTASIAAVDTLGIEIISNLFSRVLDFGAGILVGSIILIIGNFLGMIAHQKLTAAGNPGMASVARFAILGLVLAMGLKSMGLAENIVNMAFGCSIGAAAVAFALAFGLGGREAAKKVADNWANKAK